jgi:hypothetical protein
MQKAQWQVVNVGFRVHTNRWPSPHAEVLAASGSTFTCYGLSSLIFQLLYRGNSHRIQLSVIPALE